MLLTSATLAVEPYLTDKDITTIQKNLLDYDYAAKKFDIPVLILASIHYREAGLYRGWYSKKRKKLIKNVGGPFMLDLGPRNDPAEFARRIRKHEKFIHKYMGGSGSVPKISHDFRFSAIVAAYHLRIKTKCPLNRIDCLSDAVWGYNGRAAWHKGKHQNSSYVWSDPKNGKKMLMRFTKRDGTIKEFVDTRPGVMVIYKELIEIFGEI